MEVQLANVDEGGRAVVAVKRPKVKIIKLFCLPMERINDALSPST